VVLDNTTVTTYNRGAEWSTGSFQPGSRHLQVSHVTRSSFTPSHILTLSGSHHSKDGYNQLTQQDQHLQDSAEKGFSSKDPVRSQFTIIASASLDPLQVIKHGRHHHGKSRFMVYV
jgi:hypothetical protein